MVEKPVEKHWFKNIYRCRLRVCCLWALLAFGDVKSGKKWNIHLLFLLLASSVSFIQPPSLPVTRSHISVGKKPSILDFWGCLYYRPPSVATDKYLVYSGSSTGLSVLFHAGLFWISWASESLFWRWFLKWSQRLCGRKTDWTWTRQSNSIAPLRQGALEFFSAFWNPN